MRFWAGGPGTVTPAGLWIEIARDLIVRDGLDPAARRTRPGPDQRGHGRWLHLLLGRQVHLLERATDHGRPQSRRADPDATVPLLHLRPLHHLDRGRRRCWAISFPRDAAELAARADEAKNSRLWAGIHFPIDNEMGALGGGMIGRLVVVRARADEADGST